MATKPQKIIGKSRSASENSAVDKIGKSVYRINPSVIFREAEGKIIAVVTSKAKPFFFNIDGLASELWGSLDGKTPLLELVQRLKPQAADATEENLFKFAVKFMEELERFELVHKI